MQILDTINENHRGSQRVKLTLKTTRLEWRVDVKFFSSEIFRANINSKVFNRSTHKGVQRSYNNVIRFSINFHVYIAHRTFNRFVRPPFCDRVRNIGRNIESYRRRDYHDPAPVSLGGGDIQQEWVSLRRYFDQQQIRAHSRALRQMVFYLFLLALTTVESDNYCCEVSHRKSIQPLPRLRQSSRVLACQNNTLFIHGTNTRLA